VSGSPLKVRSGMDRMFVTQQTTVPFATQTLLDLGWPGATTGPRVATRPVCAAWLALRAEVNALVEMKRLMAGRFGDAGGDKKKRRR